MKNSGYLIVKKPDEILRSYEESIVQRNVLEQYKKFRNAFSYFNPTKYLGISRDPMFGVPKKLQSEFIGILEPEAVDFLSHIQERNLYDDDLIYDYSDAINTFKKIKNKQIYDIIHVRKETFEDNSNVLGFDIGYWEEDHFSLIADTIVTPTWHGPPEKDYNELLDKLKPLLNENLLFNTVKEAEEFKSYYKTKDWAETEGYPGEFCTIQIQRINY